MTIAIRAERKSKVSIREEKEEGKRGGSRPPLSKVGRSSRVSLLNMVHCYLLYMWAHSIRSSNQIIPEGFAYSLAGRTRNPCCSNLVTNPSEQLCWGILQHASYKAKLSTILTFTLLDFQTTEAEFSWSSFFFEMELNFRKTDFCTV